MCQRFIQWFKPLFFSISYTMYKTVFFSVKKLRMKMPLFAVAKKRWRFVFKIKQSKLSVL